MGGWGLLHSIHSFVLFNFQVATFIGLLALWALGFSFLNPLLEHKADLLLLLHVDSGDDVLLRYWTNLFSSE